MSGFEYFDHTADVGMRVNADSFPELLQLAALGLSGLIVPDLQQVRIKEWRTVELDNTDHAYLFFDWLSELTFLFESEGFIGSEFQIEQIEGSRWRARAGGELFDPDRHPSGNEVKAVTYHGLYVENTNGQWRAEVIFDI